MGMPEVLDEHGNYGAVVRFTQSEWKAAQKVLNIKENDNDVA